MQKKNPMVLIVEDHVETADMMKYVLEQDFPGICVVVAGTVGDAKIGFAEGGGAVGGYDAIFMDGKLGRDNSLELIKYFRQHYQGPIVACSGDRALRGEQILAGCDYLFNKGNVVEISDFLGKILQGSIEMRIVFPGFSAEEVGKFFG